MDEANLFPGNFAQLTKLKILIVDDEPSNVFLLEELLQQAGYTRVMSLTDSSKAVETCVSWRPDILLLDLMMPPPDGFAILEALRTSEEDTFMPVIVLTADVSEQAKRRALTAGATDFLLKPFDPTEVLLRLRNFLQMRRLQNNLDIRRAALEEAAFARALEIRDLEAQVDGGRISGSE